MTFKKWLILIFVITLIVTGYKPYDFFTWVLEVSPAVIGLVVLIATDKKFQFSNFVYVLLLVHAIVLAIGGHWTYARVPLFEWFKEIGLFERNNYDKVGHFMQGFVPVLAARELLIRLAVTKTKRWADAFAVSIVLAASAFYEFVEWWVALAVGSAGDSFLGTQGYVWDTQSDMFLCFIGALVGVFLFGRYHDKKMPVSGSTA